MRELIYVSNTKLRQLMPELPRRSGRLREVEAEVKTPVGGFKVGKANQETEPGLADVVAALESSSRAPRWFTDPTVRPGNWVHFEAPMSYCRVRQAVVFLDVNEASTEHPSGGDIRLLLHGSYRHLVGTPLPNSPAIAQILSHSGSHWLPFLSALRHIGDTDSNTTDDSHAWAQDTATSYAHSVLDWVDGLAERLQPGYTAAWLAGYARVTAMIPADGLGTLLAATPLYVEHIEPPDPSESAK